MVTEWYNHHGMEVAVYKDLKGQHRNHCLCYDCEEFKGGSLNEEGCPLAREVFGLCVEHNLVLPVWECPIFVQKEK